MILSALYAAMALSTPHQNGDNYMATFTQIETTIRRMFYAGDTREKEMNSILTEFGPRAKAAKTRAEFTAVVNEMVHKFGDSHFDFDTPSEQAYYSLDGLTRGESAAVMPHIGAWFSRKNAGWVADMILEGEAAAAAGLKKGDVVLTVNGKPFTPVDSLKEFVGKTVDLAIVRGADKQTLKIEVKEDRAMPLFVRASKQSAKVIQKDGKKYAFFHLWTMGNQEFKTALHTFINSPRGMNTDGFILDIRDGFGGRPEGYADPFFVPGMKLESKSRNVTLVSHMGYDKPLAVLINKGSRSAKEVFAELIKTSKRGTLVGDTTAGNVLGSTPIRINDWSFLLIPIVDMTVDGKVLEGHGVTPDVSLTQEFDKDGNDLFIQKGIEVIQSKLK